MKSRIKEELNKFTIIVDLDLEVLLYLIQQVAKIGQHIKKLNNAINKLDPIERFAEHYTQQFQKTQSLQMHRKSIHKDYY